MSAMTAVIPLLITLTLLGCVAVVGFVAYSIAMDVADKTSKTMEKKHVSLSKDGVRVGVKEKSAEEVGDSTQRVLMKTLATQDRPAFQLRTSLSGHSVPTSASAGTPTPGTERRRPFASSRGSSSSFSKSK